MTALAERVLVVDDEPLMRRLVNRALSSRGYQCAEADNADLALEKLREQPTELVILDVMMPGKTGVDLLPEIKANHPETAVIMVTATVDPDIIVKCMRDGAQDYIRKPFDSNEIARAVQSAIAKKRVEIQTLRERTQLKAKVDGHQKEIRGLFLVAIDSLVSALEAKDEYTAGHSRRVASIALAVGERIGLSDEDLEHLRWGALLHDIGKIGIDSSIQNKPSQLTPEEREKIALHPILGSSIIRPLVNERVATIVRHHHDRFDGQGRQAVPGEVAPIEARILAVADSYDAMTSDRPYRKAMPKGDALVEIIRCSGTQFDPVTVKALMGVAEEQL